MSLRVVDPGVCASVQDLGRYGHASLGVVESGAADTLSLRVGNRLVGNADGLAGIEVTYPRAEFLLERSSRVLLAACGAELWEHAGCEPPRRGESKS